MSEILTDFPKGEVVGITHRGTDKVRVGVVTDIGNFKGVEHRFGKHSMLTNVNPHVSGVQRIFPQLTNLLIQPEHVIDQPGVADVQQKEVDKSAKQLDFKLPAGNRLSQFFNRLLHRT